MNRLFITLVCSMLLALISCNNAQQNQETTPKKVITKSPKSKSPLLGVDDYQITNNRFRKAQQPERPVFKFDAAYFCNNNEVIAYKLYTDYFRAGIFHFYNDAVPEILLKELQLNKPLGKGQTVVPKMNELHTDYFVSKKGFRLGDSKEKAVDIYKTPDIEETKDGIEHLKWTFIGDEVYDGSQDLKGRPVAYQSYGHTVHMYFKNNKMVGHYLINDAP